MEYTTLDGIVSNFERTIQVSGGGETGPRTSHVSIFCVAGERVLLKTSAPAMLADGDHVKLVGMSQQGQFTAEACKNLTTGWTTTPTKLGCVITALIILTSIGILLNMIFFPAIIMALFAGTALFLILRQRRRAKRVYEMLNQ